MKEIEVRQKIEVEEAKREVRTNSIFVRNGDVTELRCSALRAENGGLRSFTTGQLSQPIRVQVA